MQPRLRLDYVHPPFWVYPFFVLMLTSAKRLTSESDALPHPPDWWQAIAEPAAEFGPVTLPVLQGALPKGLRGCLYRNGPGRLQRAGEWVPHWFDGDGAILAVQFAETQVTALYRYVQTQGYQSETAAGQYLYGGYGQLAPGPFWRRWGQSPKNAANTSVLALPDRLLALWEGGHPYALDLKTLATLGPDALAGGLKPGQAYSAHPKHDPQTGEIYNFGVRYGKTLAIDLYRSNAQGRILQQNQIPLSRFAVIHDFCLAGPYLVFCIPPLKADLLSLLLGFKGFSDAFQWRPQLGTQILVVDRASLTLVHEFETEPWFQWHIGNGYVTAEGHLCLDLVRYADWHTNQWLAEVVRGEFKTLAQGRLWQFRFDLNQKRLLEAAPLSDLTMDFPVLPQHETGQFSRYRYLCAHDRPEVDAMFSAIARVDLETGAVNLGQPGQKCYPVEPILAPDEENPMRQWLLTVVYDAQSHQSSVHIYAAELLEAGPVCILGLPQVIPFGFHGTWQGCVSSTR
jgi:all-trans-8'-apo-beta-carotenal 15,15'-oxygenase